MQKTISATLGFSWLDSCMQKQNAFHPELHKAGIKVVLFCNTSGEHFEGLCL